MSIIESISFLVALSAINTLSFNVSIADIARQILYWFQQALENIGDFMYRVFRRLFSLIEECFIWLGELLARLIQSLIDVLVSFFNVIYDLIRALLHLVYMIGVLAVKLFEVLWTLGKLLWSFVQGLGRTVSSLFYTPRASSGHGYSEIMGKVASNLHYLQLDVVAYILLFIIWVMTALGVIQIISTLKNQ